MGNFDNMDKEELGKARSQCKIIVGKERSFK